MAELKKKIAKAAHWLTTAGIAFYFVTGFGIVLSKGIEKLTSGMVTRQLMVMLHGRMAVPFLIVTLAHVYFAVKAKKAREKAEKEKAK